MQEAIIFIIVIIVVFIIFFVSVYIFKFVVGTIIATILTIALYYGFDHYMFSESGAKWKKFSDQMEARIINAEVNL